MPETIHTARATQTLFADAHCDSIKFRIRVAVGKFDVKSFKTAAGLGKIEQERERTVRALKDARSSDYHLHANWSLYGDEIGFEIGYFEGDVEREEGDVSPFADEFMPWLGTFFTNDNAMAHIHATFELPGAKSRFPLPLTAMIGELRAEIDGISSKVPSNAAGVKKTWMTQYKDRLTLSVAADRRITFKNFDLHGEMIALSVYAVSLVEEKKP